jgi:ubiquinone/menaquinone biosynthesis C-methylase UbiE
VSNITEPPDAQTGTTPEVTLDERQRRERDYHAQFAQRFKDKITQPVDLDVIEPGPRRPWNGYWSSYDALMMTDLVGKRVMVPGCGFGEDAIRLAKLGAVVHAFDLSPDLLEISRQRAALMGITGINFKVMPAEAIDYPNDYFDLIFFNDILHHVNIPKALAEARRVLKPGGKIIANELYTHSYVQRVRESRFVKGFLYQRRVRFIYGTDDPYITDDEHKIDEFEMQELERIIQSGPSRQYFLLLGGRILPSRWRWVEKLDRLFFAMIGSGGKILAGRILLVGTVAK